MSRAPKVLKVKCPSGQCGAFKKTLNRVSIIYKEHLCTNKRRGGPAGAWVIVLNRCFSVTMST